MLVQVTGEPRWATARQLREAMKLDGERRTNGGEDAGQVNYAKLRPQDEWALRVRLGEDLSQPPPGPKEAAGGVADPSP